jgi:hypothetical protein
MDEIFERFAKGLFILMTLFCVGMFVVVLFGDVTIGLRMVNAFASMFAGLLGLGSGYILGHVDRREKSNGKEDPDGSP